jgi:hypothetical protein
MTDDDATTLQRQLPAICSGECPIAAFAHAVSQAWLAR